jgi:hypothetical protein
VLFDSCCFSGFGDVWLKLSGREMITTAARDFNSSTGWLVAGVYIVLGVHLFLLPYIIVLWHKIMG